MKKILTISIMLLALSLNAQKYEPHKSIHQIETEKYNKLGYKTETEWDKYSGFKKMKIAKAPKTKMKKIVFGWHPYWGGSDYYNYQWAYLTDFAYFSYEVNYLDGTPNSMHGWETSASVDSAQANGVRVHLTATLFGHHDDFFANQEAQQTLIDNLIAQVEERNAIGINIDFEGMKLRHKENFNNFIKNLSDAFKAEIPDGILSICLYAVDWKSIFDFDVLENYVDLYTIMGYDYYYSGSSEAGPTGQLYTFSSFNYTQSRTISGYLKNGASPEKLILGVPYFGFEWQTESNTTPSKTVKYISSRTIETIKNNASGTYTNSFIEPNSLGKYYVFQKDDKWYQTWIEDETSLKYSYKLVNQTGIGGVAIWALSYDNGYTKMWELLRDYFSELAEVPLTDTIWDLGGPKRNHFNNEKFTYTIKPTRGKKLTLTFSEFELEEKYDSLYIYDGETVYAPLIGGYSGSNSPQTIQAGGNALTLRFFSDKATVKSGWTAVWNSLPDTEIPQTAINSPAWNSTDFTADFIDADNMNVKHKFYQITDFDGNEWRANANFGFFNDNFDIATINPEWQALTGSWAIENGKLKQTDQSLANTNIYTELQQKSGDIYLYQWKMKISGTGENRRAGIHFFADDASQSNRHNSYMVYFRADNNTAQIYKYQDNNYSLECNENCAVEADVFYDYKVIFNSATGQILAFQNDVLVAQWIDENPYQKGNYISLRVGNAIAKYDDLKVYKSRGKTEEISVGANKEIRYEILC